ELAVRDGEVQGVDREDVAVALGDVLERNGRHVRTSTPPGHRGSLHPAAIRRRGRTPYEDPARAAPDRTTGFEGRARRRSASGPLAGAYSRGRGANREVRGMDDDRRPRDGEARPHGASAASPPPPHAPPTDPWPNENPAAAPPAPPEPAAPASTAPPVEQWPAAPPAHRLC